MEGRASKFYFLIFLLASFNIALGQLPPPPPGEDAPVLPISSHVEYLVIITFLAGLYIVKTRQKKQTL